MSTNSDISNKAQKAQYLLKLLGKKRRVVETNEIEEDSSQFDLLIEMTENGTDFEEELLTRTTEDQSDTENAIKAIYDDILESGRIPHLLRDKHTKFLKMALGPLPGMFKALDASQPWIYYWVLNSLGLMGVEIQQDVKSQVTMKLLALIHKDGGLGGGAGQMGHAAATYAGILALTIAGDESVWSQINREKMYQWLLTLKQDDGSFVMHVGGERDTRAVYCVLVIASLLDIITPELIEGTPEWLSRCQTFEGGFGGVPYDEAHGGYTFCAAAALLLLGKDVFLKYVDLERLIRWTVSRQLSLEGGFSGRSNKLVDGCYSFWVGGLLPIFDILIQKEVASRAALQNYILSCCQNEQMGGMRDKPSKHPDFYHTNYVLLGFTAVQNKFSIDQNKLEQNSKLNHLDSWAYSIVSEPIDESVVHIEKENTLKSINPIFGLPEGVAERFKSYSTSSKI